MNSIQAAQSHFPKRTLKPIAAAILAACCIGLSSAAIADVGLSRQMHNEVKKVSGKDNAYSWRFFIRVRNFGDTETPLQVVDDLDSQFPDVTEISISNLALQDDLFNPVNLDEDDATNVVTDLVVNSEFNGETDTDLLSANQMLPPGAVITIAYDIEIDFGTSFGPFNTSAIAVSGDNLDIETSSSPGSNITQSPAPTVVFIPQAPVYETYSCAGAPKQVVNSFNHIQNGGFTQEHGIEQATGQLTDPIPAGEVIARSFKSDGGYRGDHAAPLGSTGEIAIKTDVTAFDRHQLQYHFPGDTTNGIPASSAYLLTRGSFPTESSQRVWYQQIDGLDPDDTYVLTSYVSNSSWIDLDVEDPVLQLMNGQTPLLPVNVDLTEEEANDVWTLLQTTVQPDAQGSITPGVSNLFKHGFNDSKFALTGIGLYKCVDSDTGSTTDPDNNTTYPFAEDAAGNGDDAATETPANGTPDANDGETIDPNDGIVGTGGGGGSQGFIWLLMSGLMIKLRNRFSR